MMMRRILPVLILVASLVLALMGLGKAAYWDDEAFTAIVARNWLATGTLTGWDGRNLLGYRNGALLNEDLKPRNPPLEYYATAISFRLFGETTASGRLPFVIAGFASLLVFMQILRDECPDANTFHTYSLAALGLSVPFLLYVRQCHYYSLSLFFSLLTYWTYRRLLDRSTWKAAFTLGLSAAGTYFAHYLLSVAFLLSIAVVHFLFERKRLFQVAHAKCAAPLFLFILLAVPHAWHNQIWRRPDYLPSDPWYLRKPLLVWWYLRDLNLGGFFPWTLGLVAMVVFWIHREHPVAKTGVRFASLAITYSLVLGLLSPQPTDNAGNPVADVRYLVPMLGFLAGVSGATFALVDRYTRLTACLLLALLVGTNLLFLTPWRSEPRWLLPAYVHEIIHDYPTPYEAIATFLHQHAGQDDAVTVLPDYANYPILFYAGDKVRIACQLAKDSTIPEEVWKNLPSPLDYDECFPKWLIACGLHPQVRPWLEHFSRPHLEGNRTVQYRYQLVHVLPIHWDQTQRPELHLHSFRPPSTKDNESARVFIFQRIGTTP
ncbi:MAG: glycosyltransferase family 39 protein [Planctomycetota bacterium]